MPQLLPVVGPAGSDPDSPETRSILAVQKARLKDQHLTCEFTEQRSEDASPRSFSLICQAQVHPDLLHTFSRLVPHLCLLTEQLAETPDYWPAADEELPVRFAAFTVTGFSLGKNQVGVTLVGQRELSGGRVLNLTSSYLLFEDEYSPYPYIGLLEADARVALDEVEAALRGKCTDYRQLGLFDETTAPDFSEVPTLSPA